MKTLMSISLLLFLGATITLAQTDRQAADNRGDSTREDNREHHNYGWMVRAGWEVRFGDTGIDN